MNKQQPGLESFVESHRTDFDAFEPRADLWDDIERELHEEPTLRLTAPTPPPAPRRRGLALYGLAAALALLVVAGLAYWQGRPHPTPAELPTLAQASADLTTPTTNNLALPAAATPAQRLRQEVRQMETYYATQLVERQQQLRQLEAALPATAGTADDWQTELASLDSTYQQLKLELHRNPEPDVVLDALNRNLQIRLDILNQQVRTREQIREYHTSPPESRGQ